MRVVERSLVATAVAIFAAAGGAPDAQAQQVIQGRIVEDRTNIPIEGAMVVLIARSGRELDRVARTNKYGAFNMGVPDGQYRLSIRRIAYQPVLTEIIDIQPTKNISLNYVLSPVSVRLAKVVVHEKRGPETGKDGMAKREALSKGVFLYKKDFQEIINQPVWNILGRVPGLRTRVDGSIETLEGGARCLQFMINRLPVTEVPMAHISIGRDFGITFASFYEMLPDGLDIAGIEIYRSFSEVPEEMKLDAWPGSVEDKGFTPTRRPGKLGNRTVTQPCGLVNVWTSAAWGR